MNQDKVLLELKRDVRSLLISSKMDLDPDQLKRDYFAMLGHPIPLKRLGFKNVMDMVKEMPDVVTVHSNADGSIFLKAVSDELSWKIKELVAKQRTPKNDKARRSAQPRFAPHCQVSSSQAPFVALPRRGRVPPPIPAQLKAQLRLLLSQGPLRLSDLEPTFIRCFGHPLRVQLYGFYSTGELLEAAADFIQTQHCRLGTVISLRGQMIPRSLLRPLSPAKTIGPVKQESPKTDKAASIGPGIRTKRSTTPTAQVAVKQSPLNKPSTEITLSPVCKSLTVNHETKEVEKNKEAEAQLCPNSRLLQDHVLKLEKELRQRILENGVAGTISQELKDKLREVVAQSSDGLLVHNLPAEYKRVFGEELPLQQSGFVSITELVSAMSDTFHLKPAGDHNGQHWIVTDIQDSNSTLSGTKETGSLDCGEAQPLTSCFLNYKESPWEGKLEMNKEHITDDDENEELEISKKSKTQEMMSELYPAIHVHSNSAVPLDALQSQRLRPPTRHCARELIQVVVEYVESPGHFYIHFCDSEEARALDDMMIEMRRCYASSEVSERYHLPKRFARRGQVCVSPVGLWFYRVVIHQIVSPTQAEVYYVDYGEMTVVQITNLKFLKSCYSILPAQAVPSSLAGIKPTTGNWTTEATAYFQKLCLDRSLVGALDCYTGDVLQLYLCDTHTAEDIYIHTALLSQGHGTPCSPATSAALCVQVTPVSLYLGEGKIELPELEEETTSSTEPANTPVQSMSVAPQVEEEEMPALEIIEYCAVSPHIQRTWFNPFSALVNGPTSSCGDQGDVVTSESPINQTSPTFSPLSPPDLIQISPDCKSDPGVLRMTPPAIPSSSDSSSCRQTHEKEPQPPAVAAPLTVTPPSVLKTLYTAHLGRFQDGNQDPVSLLHLRNSGFQFPLFRAH